MKNGFCVTFDLWETLFIDRHELDKQRDHARYEGLHRVLSDVGIDVSLDSLRNAYEQSARSLLEIWRRNESIPVASQIELIIRNATNGTVAVPHDPTTLENLQKAYVEPVFKFPPKLNAEAIETLEGMKGRVRRLGLISNTGRSHGTALRRLMENYGILKYFDVTIFSDEVGFRKPDRRIFEAAVSQLGSTPAQTIHVGDDWEADIRGAKEAGMRAVLFDYPVPEEFKEDSVSLFALTRADRLSSRPERQPDAKVNYLRDVVGFLDSLS